MQQIPTELFVDGKTLPSIYSLWSRKLHNQNAHYYLSYKDHPGGDGFAVLAGLEHVISWIENFKFSQKSLDFLANLSGRDSGKLYSESFLSYLQKFKFDLNIDAAPEGSIIFPHEPMVCATGPVAQCEMLRYILSCSVNFQSAIATKFARIYDVAKPTPVFDFGSHNAPGIDGSLYYSRAAFIGGASGTDNMFASQLLKIPYIMSQSDSSIRFFDTETEAFHSFGATTMDDFLITVDSHNTLNSIRSAVLTCLKMKAHNLKPVGLRLNSADIIFWSKEASDLLQAAELGDLKIFGYGDIDEQTILQQTRGAEISGWEIDGGAEPIGSSWNISAAMDEAEVWNHKMIICNHMEETSNPGILKVRRYYDESGFIGDLLYDDILGIADGPIQMLNMVDPLRRTTVSGDYDELLRPIIRDGKREEPQEPIAAMQERLKTQLSKLCSGEYPVGIPKNLYLVKKDMILQSRGTTDEF